MGANNIEFSEKHKICTKDSYDLFDLTLCKVGFFPREVWKKARQRIMRTKPLTKACASSEQPRKHQEEAINCSYYIM